MTTEHTAESAYRYPDGCYREPWGDLYNAHEADDFDGRMIPAIEKVVREAQAEAWEDCAKESHNLGWLHDWALSDLLARNPHRLTTSPGETK